jgi:hypothetical protein
MTLDQIDNQQRYAPKTLAAIQLVDAGISPKEALQITNVKRNISNEAVSKFKAKYRKYSLSHPKLVKAANNQVSRILAGEPRQIDQQKVAKNGEIVNYIETIAPTDSNILAAASMVYDRVEPVMRQVQSINIDISAINLDDYRNGLACDMQGVSTHNTQVIDIKGE